MMENFDSIEILDIYKLDDHMLKNSDKICVIHNDGSEEVYRETDLDSVICDLDCQGIDSIRYIFAV